MGSESISSLILFIAAILVAAGVAGTLVASVDEVSGSIDTFSGSVSDDIDTDVEIISDPGSDAVYDESDETITLLVKNTGDRSLPDDGTELDVLVNGEYVTPDRLTVTVIEESTWRHGAVATVELDLEESLETDEHRVMLTVPGDEEVFEFYGP